MPCLICEKARVISVIILILGYYPKEVNLTSTVLRARLHYFVKTPIVIILREMKQKICLVSVCRALVTVTSFHVQ